MSSICTLVRLAVQGKPTKVDAVEERRHYVHTWHVARGIVDLLQAPSLAHEVYNVSGRLVYSTGGGLQALASCVPEMSHSVVARGSKRVGKAWASRRTYGQQPPLYRIEVQSTILLD